MGTLKIRGIGPIAIMSRIIYNIRDMFFLLKMELFL